MRIEHRRRASHSYAISLRLAETFMGVADAFGGRDSQLPSKVPWLWNVRHVAKWRERERSAPLRSMHAAVAWELVYYLSLCA